jgi:hypothetical protein
MNSSGARRGLRTLLLGLVLQLPALAELRYFYCWAPDPAAGVVYVSDIQPVGPIAERSAYGAEFVTYLKRQSLGSSVVVGYCTMRSTESEIQQAQRELLSNCRECKAATRLSSVQWNRQSVAAPAPPQVPVPRPMTSAPAASSGAPAQPSSPSAARAELCVTSSAHTTARRQDCINEKGASAPIAEPSPQPTLPTKGRTEPPKQTRPEPPKDTTSSPTPVPRRKTQACTTLPRERDTVIVIADPEIFVTMSPGTFLYMRDHLGNELKLGYGQHRVRPGTYKLGIYGVTDPRNPLKQSLHACVTYYADY